jgi:phosphomannomutase
VSGSVETRFRCPDETYFIDRSIHLARLADGFAACRACAHRLDDGSPATGSRLPPAAEIEGSAGLIGPEGPLGVALNEIDVAWVRRFSAALGALIRAESAGSLDARAPGFEQSADPGLPRVAVGGDGRWLSAQFVAAASEGLARSGCRVVETGASTAGSLAFLISKHALEGGLLVGNSAGAPQVVSLKCWGPSARPWSSGGTLDQVADLLARSAARASRRFGGLERLDVGPEYGEQFAELFHGLRPLRFVLDTTAAPLAEHLRKLAGRSACELVGPRLPPAGAVAKSAGRSSRLQSAAIAKALGPAAAVRRRRVERLREQVVADRAHFGLWIDGDGDVLELVDEQGRQVNGERLLLALVRNLPNCAGAPVVIEAETSPRVRQQLAAERVTLVDSRPSREAMHAAMLGTGAIFGGGPSGRLWFAGQPPWTDALRTVGQLLQLLSQADRPLSEAIE